MPTNLQLIGFCMTTSTLCIYNIYPKCGILSTGRQR